MVKKQEKISKKSEKKSNLNDLRKDLLNLRFKKSSGQLENTSEIKKTRKKIAKELTKFRMIQKEKHA